MGAVNVVFVREQDRTGTGRLFTFCWTSSLVYPCITDPGRGQGPSILQCFFFFFFCSSVVVGVVFSFGGCFLPFCFSFVELPVAVKVVVVVVFFGWFVVSLCPL